jgi:hypothetical protein
MDTNGRETETDEPRMNAVTRLTDLTDMKDLLGADYAPDK